LEPKERILQAAQELFSQYGIKSITMDDIAKHLGMSKKTIYQYLKDKEELVDELTQQYMGTNQCGIDATRDHSENAIHEMLKTMEYMGSMFSRMNPNFIYDMQKYHPKAWRRFRDFKENYVIKVIETNLKRGVTEGLYRKDLDVAIIAKFRVEQVEMAMNPLTFAPDKFNLTKVQLALLDHFMHGITTIKGHKLINQYRHIEEE
jgi:AcrR family transcriptional regulator